MYLTNRRWIKVPRKGRPCQLKALLMKPFFWASPVKSPHGRQMYHQADSHLVAGGYNLVARGHNRKVVALPSPPLYPLHPPPKLNVPDEAPALHHWLLTLWMYSLWEYVVDILWKQPKVEHCKMCCLYSKIALFPKTEIQKPLSHGKKIFLRLFFLCSFRMKTLKLVLFNFWD